MGHTIETKAIVLNLVNQGLNIKDIFKTTGVTEKTIRKWLRSWNKRDTPKLEILNSLWCKLDEQIKNEKLNAKEIKSITNDILKLQSKLSVFKKIKE